MTANATTTPTPTAIAELMMRFRTCSSCSSTENWNRDGRSGSSEPKRPTVTGTTTFYLSLRATAHGANARDRELGDVRRHLDRIVGPRVGLRPQARRDRIRHEQHPLRMNARDSVQHTRMIGCAVEHLGDNRREIVDSRADTLIHEGVEGRRGVVHLAVDKPG